MKEEYVDVLETILGAIAENPQDVSIVKTADDMGVLLTVKAAKADMGKIIGKEGQTSKAIRHVIHVIGMKHKAKVSIKILEPSFDPAGNLLE